MAAPYLRTLIAICGVTAAVQAAAGVRWEDCLRQPAGWYGGDEARAIAAMVLRYQTPEGGWPKNRDMTLPPDETVPNDGKSHKDITLPTIDNDATTTQMEFIARVYAAHEDPALEEAFVRGLDYLLAAQYPNGGWPQFFPLKKGYYTHITFNDDAMANVLTLLDDVAHARKPYGFVDELRRARCGDAVARGIDCTLKCQIVVDGVKTAWCAQNDELTLAPAAARKFEMISIASRESVGIVKFLMRIEHPSPAVIDAIESAVKWFKATELHGIRWESFGEKDELGKLDRHVVEDPGAPPIWARFYEIGTNKPVFSGRDSVVVYDFSKIERERREGYSWYGDWPESIITKNYPAWRKRIAKERK